MIRGQKAGNGPIGINVIKEKNYAWCSCGLSSKQPYCDGSHSTTEFKPIVFTAVASNTIYLCGCKHTKKSPFCGLPPDYNFSIVTRMIKKLPAES